MKQGPKAGVLGQPSGTGWEGRWEKDSGWGEAHVFIWPIHVNKWQKLSQFCKVIIL